MADAATLRAHFQASLAESDPEVAEAIGGELRADALGGVECPAHCFERGCRKLERRQGRLVDGWRADRSRTSERGEAGCSDRHLEAGGTRGGAAGDPYFEGPAATHR